MVFHITDKFLVTYVVNSAKFVTEEIELDNEYLPKSRYTAMDIIELLKHGLLKS